MRLIELDPEHFDEDLFAEAQKHVEETTHADYAGY
jgi:hypothetical protein